MCAMKKTGVENGRAEEESPRRWRQKDDAVMFQGEVAYLEESSGDEGLLVVDDILDGIATLIPLPSYFSPLKSSALPSSVTASHQPRSKKIRCGESFFAFPKAKLERGFEELVSSKRGGSKTSSKSGLIHKHIVKHIVKPALKVQVLQKLLSFVPTAIQKQSFLNQFKKEKLPPLLEQTR
jgi:hypothetical protein